MYSKALFFAFFYQRLKLEIKSTIIFVKQQIGKLMRTIKIRNQTSNWRNSGAYSTELGITFISETTLSVDLGWPNVPVSSQKKSIINLQYLFYFVQSFHTIGRSKPIGTKPLRIEPQLMNITIVRTKYICIPAISNH